MPAPTTNTTPILGNLGGQTSYCCVVDATNDYTLYTSNADTVFNNPASLTKLMTVLLVYEYHGPDGANDLSSGTVTVTAADVTQPVANFTLDSMGLENGDVISWENLLYGMFLPSGFDACMAAARVIGDELYAAAGNTGTQGVTRFVERMNARAVELGMSNTTYTDPYGNSVSNGSNHNLSTARDIAALAKVVLAHSTVQTISSASSRSVTVTGPDARTFTVKAYNVFTNGPGLDTAGTSSTRKAIKLTNYIAGKDGVWNDDVGGHHNNHAGLWSTPNANVLIVTMNSATQLCMDFDQKGMYYQLSKDFPYLWDAAGKTGDGDFASVKWLLGFDGDLTDESGAAHTQTANSVTTDGANVIDAGTDPAGSTSSAVLNAQADYVKSPSHADFQPGSGDFTAELWFAGDGVDPGSTEYVFICKWDNSISAREWLIEFNSGQNMDLFWSSGGGDANSVAYAFFTADERKTFFNGAPRHLAFVKSSSSLYLYVNGERNPVGTGTQATIYSGAADMAVGISFVAASAKGTYDEVRITKGVARYTAEVVTLNPQTWPRSSADIPPTVPPPPPPPPATAVALGPMHPLRLAQSLPVPVGRPVGAGVRLFLAPADLHSASVAAAATQTPYSFTLTMPRGVPVRGPWNATPFITARVEHGHDDRTVTPDPPRQVEPGNFPANSIVPGPWNAFGKLFRVSRVGLFNQSNPVPPPPPGSPPPPPPPGTGSLGPARSQTPSIPRAPQAQDPRVRPHIDKVASLINSLMRRGYIRMGEDGEWEVIGGGFVLPRPPAATDDRTVGAIVGCTYYDSLNDELYVCKNNSIGSAVWKKVVTA